MIQLVLLILLLFIFFSVSSAILYHIWRYSPEKNRAIVLISVYTGVSIILLFFVIISYLGIDWEGLF